MRLKRTLSAVLSAAVASGTFAALTMTASADVAFVGETAKPLYIAAEGDTYEYMYEYTVGGDAADQWYFDKSPVITFDEDYLYDINVKEYAVSGESSERGFYFIFRDSEGIRIDNTNYLQGQVMAAGDTAETSLKNIAGSYGSVMLETKLMCFTPGSVLRIGIDAEKVGYKVSASDGVELIGTENGGYVTLGNTVMYAYDGNMYTSDPITEPLTITPENAADAGEVTGSAVKITAGEGVELINVPENGYTLPGAKIRYTYEGKTYLTEPVTDAKHITSGEDGTEAAEDEYSKYLFVHFTGNDGSQFEMGEQIYFSVSDDAVSWTRLNGNEPILTSSMGTTGLRDPNIVRSPEGDKFYLIATDLHIYDDRNWDAAQYKASKSIMIWESEDLVSWSEQREYAIGDDIRLENGEKPFNVGCVWAPESIWDEEREQYMVFWASMVCPEKPEGYDELTDETEKYNLMKANSKQRIYRSYTSDFKTFTAPEIYIERDNHVIDTTILEQDGLYYRYSKNESTKRVGCEYSASLNGPWYATELGIGNCEGPTAFKFNGENKWGLFVDSLGAGWSGYGLHTAYDLFDDNSGYTFTDTDHGDGELRHGTIIPITDEEYEALIAAYPPEASETEPPEKTEEPGGENVTYSFTEDTVASAGSANNGDVREWKITSSPEYFYIAQTDLDKLEKITIRSGHGSCGGTYKLYAYDSAGEPLTKAQLAAFKTDSSALGAEIAKVTDSNDAWGYNTITIDKSNVSQDKGDGNYILDTANSSPLSTEGVTGTRALIMSVEYTVSNPTAYFDNIILSYGASGEITPEPSETAEPVTYPERWSDYADRFEGGTDDSSIVWKKFSNNSGGGSYELNADGVLTIRSNADAAPADVCYGVTAVMKNIKPDTKYYITFKEKTELTEVINSSHGLYLKPDTATAEADVADAAQITHAALSRNNGNIGIHQEACADGDWEERTIEWTSGSGIDTEKFPGDDILAAKLEFTFRSASGTVQIKDLEMFEEPEPSGLAPLSVTGNGIKRYSVVIDKIFRDITIPVYPGTDMSALDPQLELPEGVTAELTEGTWENGTLTLSKNGEPEEWDVKAEVRANPVIDGYFADPNIVIFGDTYYIYPTTDGGTDWNSTNFRCFSSKDLVNWKDEGVILELSDVPWSTGVYGWAPTIAEKDGKYYFYFSAASKTSNAKQLGVAVADSPTGPFTALDEPMITSDNGYTTGGQMIDPHVFTDDDGQSYIYWGNVKMYAAKLNDDMVSVDWSTLTDITPESNYKEGTFVIKRDGKYYFMWSDGDTGSWDYNVRYGVSDSPLGPIEGNTRILSRHDTDSPLIRGNAHHSVINIPGTDEWYICYHRFNIPLFGDFEGQASEPGNHREVCIDKMEFDGDGNIEVVTATLEGITEPVYIPQANISVSAENGAFKGVYNINYRSADETLTAYLAVYDEDGKLLRIVSCAADEEKTELSIAADGLAADTVKAFLWSGGQEPVCGAAAVEL